MNTPGAALVRQIWMRHRITILFAIGITIFAGVFSWAFDDIIRAAQRDRFSFSFAVFLKQLLLLAWLFIVLSVFNCTEFNPDTAARSFPNRLFVLPVTSLTLVAVPMITGALTVGLVSMVWKWVLGSPWSFSVGIATYLVCYQAISWTLPRIGAFRIIILGVLAFSFFAASIILPMKGIPETYAYALYAGCAIVSFIASWICIAHQRSGGGFSRQVIQSSIDWISDHLPRRRRSFRSASGAQFWYDWRRSGCFLPMLIAGVLLILIAPLA